MCLSSTKTAPNPEPDASVPTMTVLEKNGESRYCAKIRAFFNPWNALFQDVDNIYVNGFAILLKSFTNPKTYEVAFICQSATAEFIHE